MAEYSNICVICSQAFLNHQLGKLDRSHCNFIHSFIHISDDVFVSNLRICRLCCDKLGQFQLFIETCKYNLKKLTLIREEHNNAFQRRLLSSEQKLEFKMRERKESTENAQNIENSIEIILHDSKNLMEHINPVKNIENVITITKISIDDTQIQKEKDHKTIYREQTYDSKDSLKKEEELKVYDECFDKFYNQMKPLDLKKYKPLELSTIIKPGPTSEEISVIPDFSTARSSSDVSDDCSDLTIDLEDSQSFEENQRQSLSHIQSQYQEVESCLSLHPDERRRLRNREASKRYRERARRDPELLMKIREQQKKRQKKYYAKIRKIDKIYVEM